MGDAWQMMLDAGDPGKGGEPHAPRVEPVWSLPTDRLMTQVDRLLGEAENWLRNRQFEEAAARADEALRLAILDHVPGLVAKQAQASDLLARVRAARDEAQLVARTVEVIRRLETSAGQDKEALQLAILEWQNLGGRLTGYPKLVAARKRLLEADPGE